LFCDAYYNQSRIAIFVLIEDYAVICLINIKIKGFKSLYAQIVLLFFQYYLRILAKF